MNTTPISANPDPPNAKAQCDDARPKAEKEEQTGTNRIGIGVGPDPDVRQKNDAEQRSTANHEYTKSNANETIL